MNLTQKILNGELKIDRSNKDDYDLPDLAEQFKQLCFQKWNTEPKIVQEISEALRGLRSLTSEPIVRAISNWVDGIAGITRGDLESAVRSLLEAKRIFLSENEDIRAAETVAAMMIAFGMQGDYEIAVEEARGALSIFTEKEMHLPAGKIELNLSNIASRRGENLISKSHAERALDLFRTAKESEWIALAENDLAHTLTELAEFEEAERHFLSALEQARSAEMSVTEAELLASLGNLQTHQGNFSKAIRSLESSRSKFKQLEMPHQSLVAELEIAEIYKRMNLLSEAKEIFESVCDGLAEFGLKSEEARARLSFAGLLASKRDFELAALELEKADFLYETEENSEGRARVLLLTSEIYVELGKSEIALASLDKTRDLIDISNSPRLQLETDVAFALANEDRETSLSQLEKLLDRATELNQPTIRIRLLSEKAKVFQGGNDHIKALECLYEAIDEIETQRAPLNSDELRMSFFADKTEPFERAIDSLIEVGDIEKAFDIVERSRAKTLTEESSDNAIFENDELVQIRTQLNHVYQKIESGDTSSKLKNEATNLEQEFDKIRLRLQSLAKDSEKSRLRTDIAAQLKEAAKDNVSIVEFIKTDRYFSAFVVTETSIKYFPDVCRIEDVTNLVEKLYFQMDTFRYDHSTTRRFADQINERTKLILERLYDEIILPLEDELAEKIVFVPIGALLYVPFNALFDGESYLVEKHLVSIAPSAGVWLSNHELTSIQTTKGLVMAYVDENAPLVEEEAHSIASKLVDSTALIGDSAKVVEFLNFSADANLIHIACHGEFRADNPMYSNLRLADGRLTVRDVNSRQINAQLVTLSACETGVNKNYPGDEILGLARGFIQAGAKKLALSLWRVNDSSTKRFMDLFYDSIIEGRSPEESLRNAQLDIMETNKNPFYWAPFFVI